MLSNLDYKYVLEILSQVKTLDTGKKNKFLECLEGLSSGNINLKKRIVCSERLYQFVLGEPSLKSLLADSADLNEIPLDLFLSITIHYLIRENLVDCKSFKQAVERIESDLFYIAQEQLQPNLEFFGLCYFLRVADTEWGQFVTGFNAKNWKEIHLLSSVFPMSFASVNDFLSWMADIVKQQEQDGALGSIGKAVSAWVLYKPDEGKEVEDNLEYIANFHSANRFFGAVLGGLKEKQKKDTSYYVALLLPGLKPANSNTILHGLGFISQENQTDKTRYFQLLCDSLNAGTLFRREFIRLCGLFEIYNQTVYAIIDPITEDDKDNPDDILVIIEYLQRGNADLDRPWFAGVVHYVFSRSHSSYTQSLNYLLTLITEFDLSLAYKVFTFRLQVMGGIELLEDGLVEMIRKDHSLFQKKFISWLSTDDKWIHNSILHITSAGSLDKSIFLFKPEVFHELTDREKLFTAYKIVGHVYSMEILQSLLLSLVKSVTSDNRFLKEGLYFILSEYLVYNYRGTLPLIEKELADPQLHPFAKEMFEKVGDHYQSYFANLKSIITDKEIRPYKEHSQLHNFYYQKFFADIPKKTEKNSLMSLFKQTAVNANNWAIRRPNELKHTPASLGYISISSEFPSGEKLNPIYQEYIRRTYQKIEMNEISIE